MKLVFFGTPACAVPYLERLAREQQVLAVVTQPDRPRGRGRRSEAPPVKRAAEALRLPVLQPERVRREDFCACAPLPEAEALVVVAYGQILPELLCATAERPALNVHYSLLPDLRGAAPVQRALLGGRQTTGVTIQYVAEELDSGDILLQQEVPVDPADDCATLFARLEQAGVPLLSEALRRLAEGTAPRVPQDSARATYAPPLRPQEGAICWKRPAADLANQIRAFSPRPGAYCHHRDRRLKLFAPQVAEQASAPGQPGEVVEVSPQGMLVDTGQGALLLGEVQPAGRRRMPASDFARGARLGRGEVLGEG